MVPLREWFTFNENFIRKMFQIFNLDIDVIIS